MPWIAYFVAGGSTFLPGTVLIALAVGTRAWFTRRWVRFFWVALAAAGIVLVTISAEAIAWWIYLIWIASTTAWFLSETLPKHRRKWLIDLTQFLITISAVAMAISFRVRPNLPSGAFSRLYVVGDSFSAGIGNERTWPAIVAAERGVPVIDLSRAGSTIGDATRRLKSEPLGDGLVLLEIGGNDVIGHTGASQFGRDLDALAQNVRGQGRLVVMLELPLFPFDNAYGIQQRRVASRYGFRLIPRHYFVEVISTPGATTDGIHLSPAGQHRMAKMIWEIVGSSLRQQTP